MPFATIFQGQFVNFRGRVALFSIESGEMIMDPKCLTQISLGMDVKHATTDGVLCVMFFVVSYALSPGGSFINTQPLWMGRFLP